MSTRDVFSEKKLAGPRRFPEISRQELIRPVTGGGVESGMRRRSMSLFYWRVSSADMPAACARAGCTAAHSGRPAPPGSSIDTSRSRPVPVRHRNRHRRCGTPPRGCRLPRRVRRSHRVVPDRLAIRQRGTGRRGTARSQWLSRPWAAVGARSKEEPATRICRPGPRPAGQRSCAESRPPGPATPCLVWAAGGGLFAGFMVFRSGGGAGTPAGLIMLCPVPAAGAPSVRLSVVLQLAATTRRGGLSEP